MIMSIVLRAIIGPETPYSSFPPSNPRWHPHMGTARLSSQTDSFIVLCWATHYAQGLWYVHKEKLCSSVKALSHRCTQISWQRKSMLYCKILIHLACVEETTTQKQSVNSNRTRQACLRDHYSFHMNVIWWKGLDGTWTLASQITQCQFCT